MESGVFSCLCLFWFCPAICGGSRSPALLSPIPAAFRGCSPGFRRILPPSPRSLPYARAHPFSLSPIRRPRLSLVVAGGGAAPCPALPCPAQWRMGVSPVGSTVWVANRLGCIDGGVNRLVVGTGGAYFPARKDVAWYGKKILELSNNLSDGGRAPPSSPYQSVHPPIYTPLSVRPPCSTANPTDP